ncbi:hypothetical protein [Streptomyces sp. NBC_00557]|uniref:hypothetical protein n=1 Tax=Streptomyces sp. NBC_00557 TaxID=2975776 RepID=UPI002E7FE1ED|nr:hypothetical protein [Streptomyces sp. NBC_00557]WUC38659.1 hypothetical protein OG956_32725 [Streptomyces sp. NBC_00557]
MVGAVASAAWAAGLFLIGGKSSDADLRGYSAPSHMCSSADYSSFLRRAGRRHRRRGLPRQPGHRRRLLEQYDQDTNPPALSDVDDWLRKDAKATLGQLKG